MSDGRILCFNSPATAAEFFALEKNQVEKKKGEERMEKKREGRAHDKQQMKRKRRDREDEEEPERKRPYIEAQRQSVFTRLGHKNQPKKTHKPQRRNRRSKGEVHFPEWNNHSLMGDSIMVRLAKAMQVPLQNSSACRGGLTTSNLVDILRKLGSTPKNVILMIGVNDVMGGTSKDAIVQNFHQILTMLRLKGTEKAILIELLPVLNLRSPQITKKIQEVNASISQMEGGIVQVLAINKFFVKKTRGTEQPNHNLFEREKSANAIVLHPGAAGVQLIIQKLKTLMSYEDDLIVF